MKMEKFRKIFRVGMLLGMMFSTILLILSSINTSETRQFIICMVVCFIYVVGLLALVFMYIEEQFEILKINLNIK